MFCFHFIITNIAVYLTSPIRSKWLIPHKILITFFAPCILQHKHTTDLRSLLCISNTNKNIRLAVYMSSKRAESEGRKQISSNEGKQIWCSRLGPLRIALPDTGARSYLVANPGARLHATQCSVIALNSTLRSRQLHASGIDQKIVN